MAAALAAGRGRDVGIELRTDPAEQLARLIALVAHAMRAQPAFEPARANPPDLAWADRADPLGI
jgi:hypothetical protein